MIHTVTVRGHKSTSCLLCFTKNNFLEILWICPSACEPLGSLSSSIQDSSSCDKVMLRCEETCNSEGNWQTHCLPHIKQGVLEKLLPGCPEAAKLQHFSFVLFHCTYNSIDDQLFCQPDLYYEYCWTMFVSKTALLKGMLFNHHRQLFCVSS